MRQLKVCQHGIFVGGKNIDIKQLCYYHSDYK